MDDGMGLFAPKPLVVVAGKDDPIIPLKSVLSGFERLKNIYTAYDASEHCQLVVGNGGHRFYAAEAWAKMLPEIL